MTPIGLLALHLALVLAITVALGVLPGLLGPREPSAAKLKPYECGVSEPQATEQRWPVRFALVAMLFLIFDVESLFLFPWAVQLRELSVHGLLAMASFVAVLGGGYLYARRRGALSWR